MCMLKNKQAQILLDLRCAQALLNGGMLHVEGEGLLVLQHAEAYLQKQYWKEGKNL